MRWWRVSAALLAVATLPGCMSGFVFTQTVRPLDVNLNNTPFHQSAAESAANTLEYYVRIDWGSYGPGDIAKDYGFSRIHYADLELLSVLGIYTRRTVHVYGERGTP